MKPSLPTEKQIITAQQIAEKLGRGVPEQALKSELAIRMWTNSKKGQLSEQDIEGIIPPRRYERLLAAIEWYQQKSQFERIACPHDGVALVGQQAYGHVNLQCPVCDFRVVRIPAHIEKLYWEACDASPDE